jgi:hypothetical protein
MSLDLFNSAKAAQSLGVSVPTLYDWLSQSDAGTFQLRGLPVTIEYFQGGARGQGKIMLEAKEIERLLALMRVRPRPVSRRKLPTRKPTLQHITTKLGRPDE